MVSEDRRSLRFKRQIDLKEFDFDEEIVLRLFKANDVVQVTFQDDLEEYFATMKCCELPLSLTEKTIWFAQVKTKQVRISLQLDQNESLIPVPVAEPGAVAKKATGPSMLDNLLGGLKLGITQKAGMAAD